MTDKKLMYIHRKWKHQKRTHNRDSVIFHILSTCRDHRQLEEPPRLSRASCLEVQTYCCLAFLFGRQAQRRGNDLIGTIANRDYKQLAQAERVFHYDKDFHKHLGPLGHLDGNDALGCDVQGFGRTANCLRRSTGIFRLCHHHVLLGRFR